MYSLEPVSLLGILSRALVTNYPYCSEYSGSSSYVISVFDFKYTYGRHKIPVDIRSLMLHNIIITFVVIKAIPI